MSQFLTLFQKEIKESFKDGKLIWLPIVFMILGISQPISSYYMQDILEMSGSLPKGTILKFPKPSGEEVLAQVLSQFGLIGTAIIVLSAMGCVASERNNGSLSLIMARPISSTQYITSKWASQAAILLVSFTLSYGLSYYYTSLLFHSVSIARFFSSLFIYSLWIIFVLTITLFFGVILRKAGGIAGASILLVSVLSLGSSLFSRYSKWSPSQAKNQAVSVLLEGVWGDSFLLMLISTVCFIFILLMGSVLLFKRYESY
ncbi:ABC transporter permease [Bacillus sp. 03113]|uniref:ABC transporter permease n=1 Tax=Bacillus sp. 03113 TaxID=2578211 RepID=UPI00114195A7|nr:ABC transporter permease subunit [Bacillus sp. 03113]